MDHGGGATAPRNSDPKWKEIVDTLSAPYSQNRLDEIERLLDINEHHIIDAFRRQCRRYAPEAFHDEELYADLFGEATYEYTRRLLGYPKLPANPPAWFHKYSDEALLRAKEIVWSGADHDHDGDDFEPAIQRPDRLRQTKWIVDLYADALADHPYGLERAMQAVEVVIHLRYHSGGSGQLGNDRFPYATMAQRFSKDHLPVDRSFVDWTVERLVTHKPIWAETNIFGPLDNRRDAHTIGDRSTVIAETISCDLEPSVDEMVEDEWIVDDVVPDLTAAIEACRRGTPVDIVIEQLLDAEPWIGNTGATVIDQITIVLIEHGATAA